jgi:hypothetical protein
VAVIVPEPVAERLAPVPTTMAATIFVPEVSEVNERVVAVDRLVYAPPSKLT